MNGTDNELSHDPVAVLGAGSWGTALAIQFARAGHPTRLWSRSAADVAAMRAEGIALSEGFAAAHVGVPFSSDFPGTRHSTTISNLRAAVAGDTAQLA